EGFGRRNADAAQADVRTMREVLVSSAAHRIHTQAIIDVFARPKPSDSGSSSFDFDALRLILSLLGLGQVYRQHTLPVRRCDLVGIDVGGQLNAASEVSVCTLASVHVPILRLF